MLITKKFCPDSLPPKGTLCPRTRTPYGKEPSAFGRQISIPLHQDFLHKKYFIRAYILAPLFQNVDIAFFEPSSKHVAPNDCT
jgi:hypothetical protein